MRKYFYLFVITVLFTFTGCEEKAKENIPAGFHAVTVEELINASNYTYLRVSEDDKEYWIAVPQMNANEGDMLYFSKSMEMKNFQSKSLNKTFESILFVEDISTNAPKDKSVPMNHPQISSHQEKISVQPLVDGKTVGQIFSQRNELAGKTVKLRGVVIKFNGGILDRNWIHLQDGTSSDNNFDLMVTSQDNAEVGKTVVVEGIVAVNKDFGNGYSYAVMIEDAKVKLQ